VEDLAKKASAILVVYLFVSLEFGYPFLSFRDVSAQAHDSYEEFLRKLGDYFEEAAPPESAPIDECEYTIPEGLDPYVAERIWKELGALVSLGRPPEDLSNYLKEKNFTLLSLKVNGTEAKLNFSGLSVVRGEDGSVRVKVPVVSNETLDYMSYNSTDVRKLYRVWNETSLRYYRVSRISGYTLTYLDLESGESYSVNSELAVSEFPRGGLMDLLPAERLEIEELNWGTIAKSSGTPVIAVPGHYEEVKVVVPEQRANFKVLFPAYDPAVYEGWLINTAISSTSVTAGQSFTVSYSAYPEGVDPEQVPLQARVSVSVPSAIQLIGSGSAQLDNSHRSGSFSLKALRAGTYDVTLRVEGNALFYSLPPSGEIRYTVQVTTPTSPSVSVSITDVDTSVPKYARLKVKLQNNGGSAARSLTLKVSGDVEEASWSVGDLAPGQSSDRELNVKLKEQEADIAIEASYLDDGGNRFLSKAWRQVFSLHFVVPEHYEDYVVTIPEHEETTTVFVPGYEGYTHVRFYAAYSFAVGNPNIYGPTAALFFPGIVLDVPTLFYEFFGTKITRGETLSLLRTYLIPLPLPGLELSVSKDGNFSQPEGVDVNFMLTGVEPRWEEVGLLEEGEAARAGNLTREQIRSGDTPDTFRAEFVKEVWVPSRKAVMNLSEFVKFRFAMESYIAENSLANELRYRWEEFVNATRIYARSKEGGFAVFVYHPLTVRGSGALKSVQVKNYAACNASYELRVVRRSMPAAGFGVPALEEVMNTTSIEVPGTGDLSLFASSLAREGYQLRAQLVYGCRVVAEVVFDLQPELSPFWAGFWDGVKEKLPGMLITSSIIIAVGFLTGHGSTAAYAGVAVSIVSTLVHLVGGTLVNWDEIKHGVAAYSLFDNLSAIYRGWSYELSNYTPPKAPVELPVGPRASVYIEAYKPRGLLASLYWNYSLAFNGAARRIAEDTVLDLVFDCGITDFEVALNPSAEEYRRGYATGRIAGTALSLAAFVVATKIANIEAKAANLKIPWKLTGALKAWVTPAIYDLAETIVRSRRTIALIASNPGYVARIAKLLFFGALEGLKGKVSGTWASIRERLYDIAYRVESGTEEAGDLVGRAMEGLVDFVRLHDEMHRFARDFEQEEAVDLNYAFDGAGLKEVEQVELFREMDGIALKSKGACKAIVEWLRLGEGEALKGAAELTSRIAGLTGEELDSIAPALKKVEGDFDDGLRLFTSYFEISENYKEDVVEAVKKAYLRYVADDGIPALEAWSSAIKNGRLAARCSGDYAYPRVPEDLIGAYGFEGSEMFTVIVRRGGEEYWVAGRLQKFTPYVTPHERMFQDLGLVKGEYVELIPGRIDGTSLFPALGIGAERVDYHISEKWDSVDGVWIMQKGGEGDYLTSCRKIGYLDKEGNFRSELGESHYYIRKVKLGGKLEFNVDERATENHRPVYEVKAIKIERSDLVQPLKFFVEKEWITYDASTGGVKLAGFPELGDRSFEYEGRIAADAEHHGGIQAVFVLNPGEEREMSLAVRVVANPETGELVARLDFSYDIKLGDWLGVTELERYDDGSKLRIEHEFRITAEKIVECNEYLKWNPESKLFEYADIRVGSKYFIEGVERMLKIPFKVEYIEENEIGLKVYDDYFGDYEGLFWEISGYYEEHAKGLLSCEKINRMIDYENVKRILGVPEDTRIVDESGQNKGEYWFDIFTKKTEKELTSVMEIKSAYAENKRSLQLDTKLESARNSLKDRFDKVSSTDIRLPDNNYYAIAIGFTRDGWVYITWQKFTKEDVMNLGD